MMDPAPPPHPLTHRRPGRPGHAGRYAGLGAALAMLLALGACEAGFEPQTGQETEFFGVFGFLDASADTQFVRVSPLRPLLDPASRPGGTTVSTARVEDGTEVAWQDSLVQLDDGTTDLLFFAPFRPQPGGTYRLAVRGPADGTTLALTQVPPERLLRTPPAVRQSFGGFVQTVTWLGVTRRPSTVTLSYLVRLPSETAPDTLIITFAEDGSLENDGWGYAVNLTQHRSEILQRFDRDDADSSLVLLGLRMEIEQRSDEWLHREQAANIQNGFGFFGAVGRYAQTWTLDATQTVAVGFTPP